MYSNNSSANGDNEKSDNWSFSFDYQRFSNKNKPRSLLGRRTIAHIFPPGSENVNDNKVTSTRGSLYERTPLKFQDINATPLLTYPVTPKVTPHKFSHPTFGNQLFSSKKDEQTDQKSCSRKLGVSTPFRSNDNQPLKDISCSYDQTKLDDSKDRSELNRNEISKDLSMSFVPDNKDLNTSFIYEGTYPLPGDSSLSNEENKTNLWTTDKTGDLSQSENNNSCFMTAHEIHPSDLNSFKSCNFNFKTPRRIQDSNFLKTPGRNFSLFEVSQSPVDLLAGILNEDNESFNSDNSLYNTPNHKNTIPKNSGAPLDLHVSSSRPTSHHIANSEEDLNSADKRISEVDYKNNETVPKENQSLLSMNSSGSKIDLVSKVKENTLSNAALQKEHFNSFLIHNEVTKQNNDLEIKANQQPLTAYPSKETFDFPENQIDETKLSIVNEQNVIHGINQSKSCASDLQEETLDSYITTVNGVPSAQNMELEIKQSKSCDSDFQEGAFVTTVNAEPNVQRMELKIPGNKINNSEMPNNVEKRLSNAGDIKSMSNCTSSQSFSKDPPTIIVNNNRNNMIQGHPIKNSYPLQVHAEHYVNPRLIIKPQPQNILYVNDKPYAALSLLGRGGSSEVYQVLDENSSRLLAVKCVNLANVEDSTANGYLNEIELLSKLQGCPSVIKMFDNEYVESTKMLYVVMEKGDTDFSKLVKDITKIKKIPMSMIIYYWTEMLSAVKDIHDKGVIHSDLKPGNFLLVCGRLKLIDFGIASSLQGDMTSVEKDVIRGTFNYISPEAISAGENRFHKINYKSDVWSLGCILYNLLFGCTPFSHITSTLGKFQAIADPNVKIKFPKESNHVPPALMLSVRWCLIKDPKSRPTVDSLLKLADHAIRVPQIDKLWYQCVIKEFPDCCVTLQDMWDKE